MDKWLYMFPVPEESPAHHFRALRITISGVNWFPDKFFERAPRFTNVRNLSLFGGKDLLVSRLPSLWRLPESVTSLTLKVSKGVSLVRIWDITARLPNLEDLSLWGQFIPADRMALVGTVPRGRLGGELVLRGVYCTMGGMDMLEIPTALPFSKVKIDCGRQYIPRPSDW